MERKWTIKSPSSFPSKA